MKDHFPDNSLLHIIIIIVVVGMLMFWLGMLAGLEIAEIEKIIIV